MALVNKRFWAAAVASGELYRSVKLLTNCPGILTCRYMTDLLRRGDHITSSNT